MANPILRGFDLTDSFGTDISQYELLFKPGFTDIGSQISSVIAKILYSFGVMPPAAIAAWILNLVGDMHLLLDPVQKAYMKAFGPVLDFISIPQLVLLAVAILLVTLTFESFFKRTASIGSDFKRIISTTVLGGLIIALAANPLILVTSSVSWTSDIAKDVLRDEGGQIGSVVDTYIMPITQMSTYGRTLSEECSGQWSRALAAGKSSFSCMADVKKVDPGMIFGSFIGMIVALAMLVFAIAVLIAVVGHLVVAIACFAVVLPVAAISLAQRRRFTALSRLVGFGFAHLFMSLVVIVYSILGPSLVNAFVGGIAELAGTPTLLVAMVLMAVGYGALTFGLWKLVNRSGRLARALRIGTSRKMEEYVGTDLPVMQGLDGEDVPSGFGQKAKRFGGALVGMTGLPTLANVVRLRRDGDDDEEKKDGDVNSEEAVDQDERLEAGAPAAAPTPDAGVGTPVATTATSPAGVVGTAVSGSQPSSPLVTPATAADTAARGPQLTRTGSPVVVDARTAAPGAPAAADAGQPLDPTHPVGEEERGQSPDPAQPVAEGAVGGEERGTGTSEPTADKSRPLPTSDTEPWAGEAPAPAAGTTPTPPEAETPDTEAGGQAAPDTPMTAEEREFAEQVQEVAEKKPSTTYDLPVPEIGDDGFDTPDDGDQLVLDGMGVESLYAAAGITPDTGPVLDTVETVTAASLPSPTAAAEMSSAVETARAEALARGESPLVLFDIDAPQLDLDFGFGDDGNEVGLLHQGRLDGFRG